MSKIKTISLAVALATTANAADVVNGTKAAISSKGELLLYGVIGDWWDDLDAESVVRQVEHASAGADELIVRIHSAGGLLMEGLAIYNALKQSDRRVVVYIDGIAASMASAVACAADEVRMPTNALMMLHKPSATVNGTDEELRDAADTVSTLEDSYIDCYVGKATWSAEELKALIADGKDHWFTAEQCLEHGLCDSVLEDPVAVAATYRVEDFHNPPAGLWGSLVSLAAPAAKPSENEPMKFNLTGGGILAALITTALYQKFDTVELAVTALASTNIGALDQVLTGQVEATDAQLDTIAKALNVEAPAAPAVPGAEPGAPAPGAPVDVQAAIAEERTRVSQIQALGDEHGLDSQSVTSMIGRGIDLNQARSEALDLVTARANRAQPVPGVRVTTSDGEGLRVGMATALLHRCKPGVYKLDEGSQAFAYMSLIELARAHLRLNGVQVDGKSPGEIATMAMQTTSDFANILADVANKSMRRAYEAAPRTFTRIARQTSAADFKAINRPQLSGAGGTLSKVNESGEFTRGSLVDGNESYSLATYGEVIAITRQTIINDDLNALDRLPAIQGGQVAETESSLVWGLITGNVVMGDGDTLFHANHANQGSTALGETSLSGSRKRMRKQTAPDGETPLNLTPVTLAVPAALETEAQKLIAAITASTSSEVNPFAGSLELLVESRLDAASETKHYLFADSDRIDTIEYAYLEGQEGAYMETRNGFDVDGIEAKVRLDFGAGVLDYRGIDRNGT